MGDILTVRFTDGAGRRVVPRRTKLMTKADWTRVAELMAGHVTRRTRSGQGADGALPAYDLDTTERTGQAGAATLNRTGRMLNTLERVADDKKALVRPTAPYARFHLTGTRHMPARDFLAFDDQLEELVAVETGARIRANVVGEADTAGALASTSAEPSLPGEVGTAL